MSIYEKVLKDSGKRKFLVTGASGFLGKEIVKRLLNEGVKVVAADFRIGDKLKSMASDKVEIWQVDLTSDYGKLPQGITDVIHAAGRVADWGSYESFHKINVDATVKLMNLSKEARVKKFLFVSSIDIHGFMGHNEETEEGTYYPTPGHFYPITKTIAEKAVREFNSPEMKTVCIRPCTVYGPGDTTVHKLIMEAIEAGKMGFIDKGTHLISRVYVEDLVDGLIRSLELGNPGEAYNIVSGEKINWLEWVDYISKELGVKTPKLSTGYGLAHAVAAVMEAFAKLFKAKNAPMLTKMRIEHAGHDFYFVPTKAKAEIGFVPKMEWHQGVKNMVNDYLENKKAERPIK
jgi:nucleoside-diphosphate-sugar epimerase